ncbi:putative bacteriophage protein [Caballeronia catudaia]|uniref:Bacteriophage protein n=1 Tax=Caballeronia catudaia TaxID=1777136 RepID=A0A158DPH9_9BURK|nr:baseplate J/gp47 family protein [Caballeronia catudaia]SAK96393.1 putative bacteriophage protein [Caballeronia catudaia]
MQTNVPPIQFTDQGPVVPAESTILAGVQSDINAAFGGGVNPGLTTPQGQLAQSLAAIIGDKNDDILEVANQVDPDVASGRWQDAIGRIYFLNRIAASGTVVTATCIGLVGAVIPAGSVAQDVNGYLYASTAAVTIRASGKIDVPFQCQTMGPIACPIGALATIYTAAQGWDRVTNSTAGTPGQLAESRAAFEARRRLSVAINSVNGVQSVYGAVLNVPNVLDAFVIDNPTGTVEEYGATHYPLLAHSLFVSTLGGDPAAIAAAIWSKKAPGCDYNGDTTFVVTDTSYDPPQPQYTIKWVTPAPVQCFFAVTIQANDQLPADITQRIQQAIIAAFNGEDGGAAARIGSTTYAGRYYAGVAATDSNVNIFSIALGTDPMAVTQTSLAFGIDQYPTLDPSNVSVLQVASS